MFPVTEQFKLQARASVRKLYRKVTFGSRTVYDSAILSMRFTEAISEDDVAMGNATSQMLELEIDITGQPLLDTSALITPYISFDGLYWMQLGEFFKSDMFGVDPEDPKVYKIIAYDRMAGLTNNYTLPLNMGSPETDIETIVQNMASRFSFNIDPSTVFSGMPITGLGPKAPARDWLGWLAGCQGCNAKFNRYGQLRFVPYAGATYISGDVTRDGYVTLADYNYIAANLLNTVTDYAYSSQLGSAVVGSAYLGGYVLDQEDSTIADVNGDHIVNAYDLAEINAYLGGHPYAGSTVGQPVSEQIIGTDDYIRGTYKRSREDPVTYMGVCAERNGATTMYRGSGNRILFYCPPISSGNMDEVYDLIPFSYMPGEIEIWGEPHWEVGDIITIITSPGTSYSFPIMRQELDLDEGFHQKVYSFAKDHYVEEE